MAAFPKPNLPEPIGHLLTVAEYAELGVTETGYTELQEGRLLMSPSPVPDHNLASFELAVQLRTQLPDHLLVVQDIDVDLQLVMPGIVDLDEPVSLIACHLAGEFGYQDTGAVSRTFGTSEPFPVRLRLDQLF